MFKYWWLISLFFCSAMTQAADVRVAAATNLRHVLPELVAQFQQETGDLLAVSYAASGTLATQVEHGAPFDLFLSAHPDYISRLKNGNLTSGEAINFAQAQMVFFVNDASDLEADNNLLSLSQALAKGVLKKVAIANPVHAPYGQAAKRVLEQKGLWQAIQPYLIIAENASQAVQFSLSSSVDAGFLPYSHVIQPQLSTKGQYVKLDAQLPQQAVLLNGNKAIARKFLAFIQSKQAQTILMKHGFLVKG